MGCDTEDVTVSVREKGSRRPNKTKASVKRDRRKSRLQQERKTQGLPSRVVSGAIAFLCTTGKRVASD